MKTLRGFAARKPVQLELVAPQISSIVETAFLLRVLNAHLEDTRVL